MPDSDGERAKPLTYKDAGVDIDAGDELVERIKPHVARTMRPEVLGGLGGFAALCGIPTGYKNPILVSNYTNDDAMVVSMKFASGAIGNIMASCSTAKGGGVFLNVWSANHCTKFTEWAHHAHITKTDDPGHEYIIKGDIDDIFPTEDRVFINAVKTGDRSKIKSTHADGARTTQVCLAANESLVTGQPVTVKYD